MTTTKAYEKFKIMPTLATHMLTVGAVAKIFTDTIVESDFPAKEIVSACLLHDLGNIVKFNLDKTPKGLGIPNIEYWKQEQQDIKNSYGLDEHEVTHTMAHEISVSDITLNAIDNCGSAKAQAVLKAKNVPAMFVTYCDYHVSPTGVVAIEERIEDILHRYKDTPKYEGYKRDTVNVKNIAQFLEETYSLNETSLNTTLVEETIEELKHWDLI